MKKPLPHSNQAIQARAAASQRLLLFSSHCALTVGVLIQKYYLRHFRVIIAAFPERHRMLPDTRENICVLEKQLRTIFLLTERSPEGKLPFIRCQQFFQIGDDLFMRLLRIELE